MPTPHWALNLLLQPHGQSQSGKINELLHTVYGWYQFLEVYASRRNPYTLHSSTITKCIITFAVMKY